MREHQLRIGVQGRTPSISFNTSIRGGVRPVASMKSASLWTPIITTFLRLLQSVVRILAGVPHWTPIYRVWNESGYCWLVR
jgi:hypothetical protein